MTYSLYPELPYAHELAAYRRDSDRSMNGYRIRRAKRLGLLLPNRITSWSIAAAITLLALPTVYA